MTARTRSKREERMVSVLAIGGLTGIYLLVLTSVRPGDVAVGVVLSALLVAFGRRRIAPLGAPPDVRLGRRLAAVAALLGGTLVDLARSTWRTAAWCVHPGRSRPGLVTVTIPSCTPSSAAVWGVRVGITPDSLVVELDETRGRMLLHVLDAGDPEAVRAEQRRSYERRQRGVFP